MIGLFHHAPSDWRTVRLKDTITACRNGTWGEEPAGASGDSICVRVADFDRLWSQRRETLQKARYSWPDGRFHWDVDFFKTDDGRTYFAQAEVEMPEDDKAPPPLPPPLAEHLLALAPAGDLRFTSKRLANQAHAERLLADIRKKGKIE